MMKRYYCYLRDHDSKVVPSLFAHPSLITEPQRSSCVRLSMFSFMDRRKFVLLHISSFILFLLFSKPYSFYSFLLCWLSESFPGIYSIFFICAFLMCIIHGETLVHISRQLRVAGQRETDVSSNTVCLLISWI